ncbi:MAG: hypothetical protein LAO77_13690 [Acidobacteriia bacterium]|nr:hypothetical protein [Terriglobia bacterium]
MSESNNGDAERAAAAGALARADSSCTFGPSFFLGQLGGFVRDHCPTPDEHLPMVQILLADGRTLDLCHIIGVSPRWVMLAVGDATGRQGEMAIELVPFEMIHGVRIRTRHDEGSTVGFAQHHAPSVIAAETLLGAAMRPAHERA